MYCSSYLVESPGAVLDAPIHVSGANHGPRQFLEVVPGATAAAAAAAAAAVRGRSPLHL